MPDKKAGDISELFINPVPDLGWLDVDEKDYQALEKLPQQNFDIRPDLEELWTHHEKGGVHFVPNIDPERLGKHQWVKDSSNDEGVLALVARHVKDRIMVGWKPATVAAWVRENVDPLYIPHLIPTLRKLALEQGLLGNVYIDATSWGGCAKGEGKKVAARAPHSQFVLGTPEKCPGCMHNQEGRCSVFQKKLIFETVPYSDEVVQQYAEKLKVPVQAFSNQPDARSKLRAMFAYDGIPTDLMESVREETPPLTRGPQETRDRRAQGLYEPPPTEFVSTADRSLYRDLSQKMMANRGVLSDTVKVRLAAANSPAITTLAEEESLLGKVYVRPDQFDDCHKANKFFRRHNVGGEYIVEIPTKCARCHFLREGSGDGQSCGLMGRNVVQEIPYTHDLLSRDLSRLVDKGSMTPTVASDFLDRAAHEIDLKSIVREVHSYKAPQQDAVYDSPEKTVEMGHYAAVRDIKDQQTRVSLKHRPVMRALYSYMLEGMTGKALKEALVEKCGRLEVIAAKRDIAPLMPLSGLLGHVILDPRAFRTAADAKAHLRAASMRPFYILAEGCGCGGGATPSEDDHKKHFPNLVIINLGEIGEIEGEFVKNRLDDLENRRRITPNLAADLRGKVGTASPAALLRSAYTAAPPAPATPHRATRSAPKVNRKKVANELAAANEAATAVANDRVRNAISAAVAADQIGQNAAGKLRDLVGKRQGEKILASLEIAKMNHLPANTFSATDVGVQLGQIEATKKAKHVKVTAAQRQNFRWRIVQAMNRGMHSFGLKQWLRNSFSEVVVKSEATYLRNALKNQGLLGHHYIDPRPYSACREGAAEVSSSNAMYVQAMGKCAGCIFRNSNNHCSVYRRDVVEEVPYAENRDVAQQAILKPASAPEFEAGTNPVVEYGVMGGMSNIEIEPASRVSEQDVGFDTTMGGLGDL